MAIASNSVRHGTAWLADAVVARDRESVLTEYVSEGDLLDLGVVDSWRAKEDTARRLDRFATSLHSWIKEQNPNVLGVDIDEQGVSILRERGFNVVAANVENMQLDRQFDTIVGGEIVEHLPNPGLAMATLRRHLKPNGRLILSTPNPFFVGQIWKVLKYGRPQVHEEHTCWFDPVTLRNLLHMHGLEVERLVWLSPARRHGRWRVLPAKFRGYWSANFLVVARNPSEPDGGAPQIEAASSQTRDQAA